MCVYVLGELIKVVNASLATHASCLTCIFLSFLPVLSCQLEACVHAVTLTVLTYCEWVSILLYFSIFCSLFVCPKNFILLSSGLHRQLLRNPASAMCHGILMPHFRAHFNDFVRFSNRYDDFGAFIRDLAQRSVCSNVCVVFYSLPVCHMCQCVCLCGCLALATYVRY